MLRSLSAAAVVLLAAVPGVAQPKTWVTIKGQVVLPAAAALPAAKALDVTADKEHCLSKGALKDESLIVDPKTRGIKNVWVYLKPPMGESFAATDIHATLAKPNSVTHSVDQPCCAFIPRILAVRAGDFVEYKNSSPVSHNTKFDGDPGVNPEFNKTVPSGGTYKTEVPLAAQKGPIPYSCSIHPWMSGKIMVFDHPYYAVTDATGKFEIKLAPGMKARIFYRHDIYHKGRLGAQGFPIDIAGKDTMEMTPLEFEFPK